MDFGSITFAVLFSSLIFFFGFQAISYAQTLVLSCNTVVAVCSQRAHTQTQLTVCSILLLSFTDSFRSIIHTHTRTAPFSLVRVLGIPYAHQFEHPLRFLRRAFCSVFASCFINTRARKITSTTDFSHIFFFPFNVWYVQVFDCLSLICSISYQHLCVFRLPPSAFTANRSSQCVYLH